METHFSWAGYFLAIGRDMAIYYVIIGEIFCQRDIKALLHSKPKLWEKP